MSEIINLLVLLASVYGLVQFATKRQHNTVVFALCIVGVLLTGGAVAALLAGGGAYLYRRYAR